MTYDPDRTPMDPDNRATTRRAGSSGTIGLILGALIVIVGLFAIYSYSTDTETASTRNDTAVTGSTNPAAPPVARPAPAPAPAPAAPASPTPSTPAPSNQ